MVLIVLDDFGHADLSSSPLPPGSIPNPTPFLSSLFGRSTMLKKFISYPQCTPSRSSLLTGKRSEALGMSHYVLIHGQDYCLAGHSAILPALLPSDFESHLVGKWHLGHSRPECLPTSLGFDSFSGYLLGSIDFFSHNNTECCANAEVCSPDRSVHSFSSRQSYNDLHDLPASSGEYITDSIVSAALEKVRSFAERRGAENRLFLQVNMAATHSGPAGTAQYKESDLDEAQAGRSVLRAGFAAMAKNLDDGVRRLWSALEDADLLEDTLVVLLSDNGGESTAGGSNWPYRGEKFTYFQGGINTPAFVKLPGSGGNSSSSSSSGVALESLFWIGDVAPTVLDAVGAPTPPDMEGRSRLPSLLSVAGRSRSNNDDPPTTATTLPEAFVSGLDPHAYSGAVFYGERYKLVVNATGNYEVLYPLQFGQELRGWTSPGDADDNATIPGDVQEVMLFDLQEDEREERNLLLTNLTPDQRTALQACLEAFNQVLEETRDKERQTKAPGYPMEQVTPGPDGKIGPFILPPSS